MNDIEDRAVYQATVRRKRRFPVMWILPIIAILIGAWLAWDTLSKEGPRIVVSFNDAEGLQIGQSQLKFKDITLGTVKALDFAPDRRNVLVTIATTSQAEPFLTAGTQFWVVKPRLFAGNISGFNTLLSGSYIGMLPGDAGGKQERQFVGREEPPVLESNVPGTTFLLKSDEIGSVSLGSPVFYRGLAVGEVLGWDIGDLAENVTIHAFVRAPFDAYVHDQTRFWNASGVSVKLSGGGVEMQVESLRAVLLGGVAFETPANAPKSAVSAADHEFPLFRSEEAAKAASYSRKIPLIVYFSSSVRGLAPGAEVVAHGLKIGQVTDVRLTYDPAKDAILAPVRLEIEPERVVGVGRHVFDNTLEGIQMLVSKGFRASLQSANLLTGGQLVSIDVAPDAPPATVTMQDGAFVFPTVESGGLSSLQASAGDLLRNVNAIPFAAIGRNLEAMTKNMSELASSPQLQASLASLATTLNDAQGVLKNLDAGMSPALKQLPELATSLQSTLKQTNQLMQSMHAGYGNDTQFHRDLDRMMGQLTDAVRSFRALADLLTQHPEALLRGRANAR
ncbi:MAG TPA: MlaD family protein [Rhodopila sp.]|jgi:paraquat-inducible protein B|nr:MlaD family protein [Rhodopila sp.]